MSLKFRKDGPTYPTEVKDGSLIVYMGTGSFSVKFPFLLADHLLSNISFPMSNIMVYLDNGEEIIVMRFDGTVTKYNQNLEVVGFSKFDKNELYEHVTTLPVGCVFSGVSGDRQAHQSCVRILKGTDVCTFECTNDPEALQFDAAANPKFCEELVRGNKIFPALIKTGDNQYADDKGEYTIVSTPIKVTGFADI